MVQGTSDALFCNSPTVNHLLRLALQFSHAQAPSLTLSAHIRVFFEPCVLICRHHDPLSVNIQCVFLRTQTFFYISKIHLLKSEAITLIQYCCLIHNSY